MCVKENLKQSCVIVLPNKYTSNIETAAFTEVFSIRMVYFHLILRNVNEEKLKMVKYLMNFLQQDKQRCPLLII